MMLRHNLGDRLALSTLTRTCAEFAIVLLSSTLEAIAGLTRIHMSALIASSGHRRNTIELSTPATNQRRSVIQSP
jgi:hypothetical protein